MGRAREVANFGTLLISGRHPTYVFEVLPTTRILLARVLPVAVFE